MKYIDEYRNPEIIKAISANIFAISPEPANIMEICGGQTHCIIKYNLEEFIPPQVNFIHGPGCPVCVTPIELIDIAIDLSLRKDVILISFGDMLRVPGSDMDLLKAKAEGGDVRIIYSPLDSIKIAEQNPSKKIVYFAVGFETTAPANARVIIEAERLNLNNFFIISSNMLVPPAIELILSNPELKINALIAAGHVCTVMGLEEYVKISTKYHIPVVASGFEPSDILMAVYMALKQISEKRCSVENQYSRAVSYRGNIHAKAMIDSVFETEDREWRGIGIIRNSGLKLKNQYFRFDALRNFDLPVNKNDVSNECIAGLILQGFKKPYECGQFARVCHPGNPLGAPMVSSEGACAAYYKYKSWS